MCEYALECPNAGILRRQGGQVEAVRDIAAPFQVEPFESRAARVQQEEGVVGVVGPGFDDGLRRGEGLAVELDPVSGVGDLRGVEDGNEGVVDNPDARDLVRHGG